MMVVEYIRCNLTNTKTAVEPPPNTAMITASGERVLYTKSARNKVEVRLIMFYAAYKNVTDEERKDRDSFQKYLESFYGKPDEIFTFYPLLGDFYQPNGNGFPLENEDLNKMSKGDLYQIVSTYFRNKMDSKIDSNNAKEFNNLLKEYARWLYNYGYNDKDYNDYYKFDGVTPLLNSIK